MSSKFERDALKEMRRNAKKQESEKPISCPNCGNPFHIPGEQVLFGGNVTCPYCEQTIEIQSDAGNQVASLLGDFRKNLQRDMKRINRRKRQR